MAKYKVRISYFDIWNPILTFAETENPILIFKILFWHSHWVGKSYFDIQNPILTFALSQKILFWHSKSYFDIRTEVENLILTFKILFWHSQWGRKSYFNIQNPILTFALRRKISYFDIQIWRSRLVLLVEYFIYLNQTSIEQSYTTFSDIFSTDVTVI